MICFNGQPGEAIWGCIPDKRAFHRLGYNSQLHLWCASAKRINFYQDGRRMMTEGHREWSFNGGTTIAGATNVRCARAMAHCLVLRGTRATTPTHQWRRKRYSTATCTLLHSPTVTEVLRDIRRQRPPSIEYWLKDIPAAFDDSGVARSCLNPYSFMLMTLQNIQ